jgi:hypothetical protein
MNKTAMIPTIIFVVGLAMLILTDYWLERFNDRPSGLPQRSSEGTEPESSVPEKDS